MLKFKQKPEQKKDMNEGLLETRERDKVKHNKRKQKHRNLHSLCVSKFRNKNKRHLGDTTKQPPTHSAKRKNRKWRGQASVCVCVWIELHFFWVANLSEFECFSFPLLKCH